MKTKTKIFAFLLSLVLLLGLIAVPAMADDPTGESPAVVTVPAWKSEYLFGMSYVADTVTYLSDLTYTGTTSNSSFSPAKNAMYKKDPDSGITTVSGNTFEKGFGTHPKAANSESPSYVEIDVSAVANYDTFYAVLALTDGTSMGIKGEVYFLYKDAAEYVKVADTAGLTDKDMAEILLPAANLAKVKLIILPATDNNASSATAWANVSLYTGAPWVLFEENYNAADYDATRLTVESVASTATGAATVSVEEGKLIIDNTACTGESAVQLAAGMRTNLSDYTVEATVTMVGLENIKEDQTKETRYAALAANYKAADEYVGGWVRFNGVINFQNREGSTYSNVDANTAQANVTTIEGLASGLNVAYTLKIHFHDGTADFYVNGVKLFTGTNTKITKPTDMIGIMVKNGMKVSVDDVKVSVNAFSDPAAAAPVEVPTAALVRQATENFSLVEYDEVTNPKSRPYGSWMAGEGAKVYLSDLPFESEMSAGRIATKDAIYKENIGSGITLGGTTKYDKGFGGHPKGNYSEAKPNAGEIVVDIWQYTDPEGTYKYDTFYSAVGLTGSGSEGVWFVVYGDKGDGNGFVELACSEKIVRSNFGEFNVDITGVHTLKLWIVADGNYSASASAWGECSIFAKDTNAVKPDYTEQSEPTTTQPPVETQTPAPATTAATPESTAAPEHDTLEENKPKGCGSSIAAGMALVLLCVVSCAALILRKKEYE